MLKVVYKRNDKAGERTETCILKILAYFSVFNFPLSANEMRKFLPPNACADCVEDALDNLTEEKVIFKIEDHYSLQNDISLLRKKRDGFLLAEELLPKARRVGRFLSRFPYVRGIGISGGLSKMYAHKRSDFDFFIITKANRLWIARTLMHLFKKITFITGRQHYYCMNYFVDETALKLKDQNIYTAVETFTLMPVSGEGVDDFFAANDWVSEWFAGYPSLMKTRQSRSSSWLKRSVEWLFNNSAGNRLDNFLMKMTTRRWKMKEARRKLNYEGKEMSLITGKHFAWSNPDSFQEKIVGLYNDKISELRNKWPEYFETVNLSFQVK